MKKVYAYVVGDLLHVGHLKALRQARSLGDYLIVGVITDAGAAAYKRRPIIPLEERMELIANLKCVDEVVVQEELDPTGNLKKIMPDVLVHGDDWPADYPGAEFMRSINREAVQVKYFPGQSTTGIIEKILAVMKNEGVNSG